MSDEWQAGDLALCVKPLGRWRRACGAFSDATIRGGMICRVRRVGNWQGRVVLWFDEDPGDSYGKAYTTRRFRKIRPHKADAEDIETIRLLTGVPVMEPVQ